MSRHRRVIQTSALDRRRDSLDRSSENLSVGNRANDRFSTLIRPRERYRTKSPSRAHPPRQRHSLEIDTMVHPRACR